MEMVTCVAHRNVCELSSAVTPSTNRRGVVPSHDIAPGTAYSCPLFNISLDAHTQRMPIPRVIFPGVLFRRAASTLCRTMTCWRMISSGILRRVALVRTDVSQELSASFIRVTRIGELGTLAVTSNRSTLRFLSPWWRRRWVPPKRRFIQEPHGVASQKTPSFIVTAVKTSNLTMICCFGNWTLVHLQADFNFLQTLDHTRKCIHHLVRRPAIGHLPE
jgi:hypothetical protein